MKYASFALAGMSLMATPALAEEGFVDQVERLEIEKGEFEIEGQAIRARRDDAADATLLAATFEYGLSDTLQAGIEIETAREGGEKLETPDIGLQVKWIAVDPDEAAIGLGVQVAAVVATECGCVGSETFFIAESRVGSLDATLNLVVETEPGDWSELSSAYGARIDKAFSERFQLGLEAGGALSGEGKGSHFIGPVFAMAIGDDDAPQIEFGIFAPLSDRAPDLQLRLEFDAGF